MVEWSVVLPAPKAPEEDTERTGSRTFESAYKNRQPTNPPSLSVSHEGNFIITGLIVRYSYFTIPIPFPAWQNKRTFLLSL